MLSTLFCVVGLALLYVITSGIYLALIRFPKENGEIVINHNSWHFKLAYPFKKYSGGEMDYLKERGISKCVYFGKLFWMTWIGWPYLILQESVKFIFYNLFVLLFGYLSLPDFQKIHFSYDPFGCLLTKLKELPLPKFSGIRILPIYILAPLAYWFLWHFYPKAVWFCTLTLLESLAFIAVIAAFLLLHFLIIGKLQKKREKSKKPQTDMLALEWLKTKIRKFCPIVPIR